jgi:arylsulfatase A-like enzyme
VPTSGMLGGYTRVNGVLTPSDGLVATLDHTDQSIGLMVAELNAKGLLESTVVIISAKHGNSPMDTSTLVRANPAVISGIVNGVQAGLLAQLSADTGPLIWLKDQSKTSAVVDALKAADHTLTRIDASQPGEGVLSGAAVASLYADPLSDNRVPDIILLPLPGTVYTTSGTKIADHGGFGDEDVHVGLLVSNPQMSAVRINDAVETRQIACTVLKSLAIDCNALQSQRREPSKALPKKDKSDISSTQSIGR